ncbi:MAG: MEDS domain-containing protein [Gemmatimonadales bacterium]
MSTLLVEAPVGRHFAQLHRDAGALGDAASRFVATGLLRGQHVAVIAAPAQLDRFGTLLRAGGLDPANLQQSGRLELLGTPAVLSRFLSGAMPDRADFRQIMGDLFARGAACGASCTRIYGEMSNALWEDGRPKAAIRIEEFWNDLQGSYPLTLFCGYQVDTHCEDCYATPLEEIGRTHSDIIGTHEDDLFGEALDAAGRELFGVALSRMAGYTTPGEGAHRFPTGPRTMLWVKRHLPSSSGVVLERARRHYYGEARG